MSYTGISADIANNCRGDSYPDERKIYFVKHQMVVTVGNVHNEPQTQNALMEGQINKLKDGFNNEELSS
jgi:hypothetical protein